MRSAILVTLNIVCLLMAMNVSAQKTKNYETEWKAIDELIARENLPQSALAKVKKLYNQAKNENQDAQVVKSLVYIIGLQEENREENTIKGIKELEKEITGSKQPVTSILQSLLAGLYWQYFQDHRWQLYNRTVTINFNKEDIATWSTEDFHKKMGDLYMQSISKGALLKQTSLDAFDAIIFKGNVSYLRPTLYDLLAQKALDYFKNDERTIKKPAYAFEINQSEAFAPASEFVKTKFTTKDSLSLHHKALLVYQDFMAFHLNDTKPDALIDADIQRIEFVHGNSVSLNKDDLYIQALRFLITKYSGHPAVAQAAYLMAAQYENLATQYEPFRDTTYRYERLKAKEILDKVVSDSAVKSEGWTNCFNLLSAMNRPYISLEIEKVNIPGKPFRALVRYRNCTALNLRLIKVDSTIKKLYENKYIQKSWDTLIKTIPLKEWQQTLPAVNDMQQHAVELKVDPLPVGEYLLIAGALPGLAKAEFAVNLFYISNIGYVNQTNNYFVLHRESGQPLSNAAVRVMTRQYDYQLSKYADKEYASYKTDKNGFFQVENLKKKKNYGYYLDITHDSDHLQLNEYSYDYFPSQINIEKEVSKKIFFFTDRSIYRPGQTVFFKGIAVANTEIVPGFATTIFLQDANRQKVDSINVTTNEFGSFSGKFTLPQHLFNGMFRITDKEQKNIQGISVEEYKRPKFHVEFNKVKESYNVGDSISISGIATAYSGNAISGAKVTYRVVRQSRFLYPWLLKGWWPYSASMEIAHGEMQSDTKGQFTIPFKALPDLKLDKKFDPLFIYQVYADVTDINGETRSGKAEVAAGYKSLLLEVQMNERISVDSLKNIFIRTENMNGEYQPATITVSMTRLKPENRLIRNRYWQQPDQFVMSKEEFIRYFPNDEYKDESNFRNWPEGEIVFKKTDSTRLDGQWPIGHQLIGSGFFKIEISTKDNKGDEVKDVRFVELFDAEVDRIFKPEYIWAKGNGYSIEPGKKAFVQVGSSAQDVFLIQQVDKRKNRQEEVSSFQFFHLSNEKKRFEFAAKEEDRGGYNVDFFFIKDNRFYHYSEGISIPWTNKELNIEYATFRDKAAPGSEERWKIKISGYKGEKVAAEMLVSMYDASLDQFRPHAWQKPGIGPVAVSFGNWSATQNFISNWSNLISFSPGKIKSFNKEYDRLLSIDPNLAGELRRKTMAKNRQEEEAKVYSRVMSATDMTGSVSEIRIRGGMATNGSMNPLYVIDGVAGGSPDNLGPASIISMNVLTKEAAAMYGAAGANGVVLITTKNGINMGALNVKPRKNFSETAFFFPDLRTDKDGNIEFSFTMPEALTRWKLQTFAHTKDLAMGLSQTYVIAQKELMVQPNAPRFLRQGDAMEFSTKIVNLSNKELTGQAELQLLDATTNQPVDGWFQNIFPNQYFTVAAGGSEVVKFPIEVPYQFNNPLVWRVVARTSSPVGGGQVGASDGEEMTLPVLTNKTLVTETLPLTMKSSGSKNFTFDKLLQSGNSESLQHQSLTVEFTSNPAWYAVQALPYLMEYPYECAEQVFNRYYANALASKIAAASPRFKQIFERWKTADTSALQSNLQKNQELKSVLLEETPWVLQTKSEEQQKKNLAQLFDLVRMSNELKSNLQKLKEMQSENGGFVWFKGGADDRYMTQYILTGIGHLKKLNALNKEQLADLNSIISLALPYLDKKIREDYDDLVKHKLNLKTQHIGYIQAQYLYMRSFFLEYKHSQSSLVAYNYYQRQAKQFWMDGNKYMQGMIALALNRGGDQQTPDAILKSLKETAIISDELGMYWKESAFRLGWFWWQAPIETHALLIEAFSEISNNTKIINELKTWLLRNKQTTSWRTTKATADACYALLLQGSDWLSNESQVSIQLGSAVLKSDNKAEAGTGYFKKSIPFQIIKPEMGNITVSITSSSSSGKPDQLQQEKPGVRYGSVYWQYFEDLDKISTASTPLQLNKKMFIEKNSDKGPVLTPVEEGSIVKVGDKIKVRIELRVDRDMEYVHMKDMRASGLEPVNVLSGYKWQGGLGYYESTKDASTNFFFNYLRKGTYVFEYPLFVTHAGNFSNGVTTIQCLYAPEFSAHSEGIKLKSE